MKADKKIRWLITGNYFRVVGATGFSHTWWESNDSGVTAPENSSLFTGELGIIVDF